MTVSKIPARMGALARAAAVAALLVGAGGALCSCSAARNQLNVTSSLCYPDLPLAADAVHHRGQFKGARLVPPKALGSFNHLRQVLQAANGGKLGDVCLVDFSGSFTSSQVEKPAVAGASGTHAVVAFSLPGNHLLDTFIVNRNPVAFGKRGI